MTSSGPRGPGTAVDDSSVGFWNWNTPGNATANDGTNTACNLISSNVGHYLKMTNFGFSIPTDAQSIDGILVETKRSGQNASTIQDNAYKIVKGGTISGTDKSDTNFWPTTAAFDSKGGSSDLWGLSWTPSDINASTFGVAVSPKSNSGSFLNANVDYAQITVYYTPAAGGGGSQVRMLSCAGAGT
jgi:hypothetical protein